MKKCVECNKCNRTISPNNITKHLLACKGKQFIRLETLIKENKICLEDKKYICVECNKSFPEKGIMTHYWRTHTHIGEQHNPNIGYTLNEGNKRIIWNKGLTTDTSPIVKQIANNLSEQYQSGSLVPYFTHVGLQKPETIKQIRSSWSKRKKFYDYEYAGQVYSFDSFYEVRVADQLNKYDIKWIRPSYFNYLSSDHKIRKYFPDFYLPDYDVYLDPKNKIGIEKHQPKIVSACSMNNIKVIILRKTQLTWKAIDNLINLNQNIKSGMILTNE